VPADKLMVVLARHLGVKSVVTTVDGSGVIDELGFEVTRTRVGDAFVSDELRMELLGFLPKRWLAEVNGPALEKPETYDAPLADWEHTNKGTIHPKAQIEKTYGGDEVGRFVVRASKQRIGTAGDLVFELEARVYVEKHYDRFTLRIGDFIRLTDAEAKRKQAVLYGFKNAWIVQTLISRPE
jgi:hypothetical protein